MSNNKWIDVTLPLKSDMMHWPGDPPVFIERVRDIDKGDTVNLSKITMGVHSGTHVDAPVHFIKDAKGVHKLLFDSLIGHARVIEITADDTIKEKEISKYKIKKYERILFKTKNSTDKLLHKDIFTEDFVYMDEDAANFLVSRGIKAVGVDYLSVGGYKKNGPDVHRILLGAGIIIIEGLDLTGVSPGNYNMICLPMKIMDSDGAPARVILKQNEIY